MVLLFFGKNIRKGFDYISFIIGCSVQFDRLLWEFSHSLDFGKRHVVNFPRRETHLLSHDARLLC